MHKHVFMDRHTEACIEHTCSHKHMQTITWIHMHVYTYMDTYIHTPTHRHRHMLTFSQTCTHIHKHTNLSRAFHMESLLHTCTSLMYHTLSKSSDRVPLETGSLETGSASDYSWSGHFCRTEATMGLLGRDGEMSKPFDTKANLICSFRNPLGDWQEKERGNW